MINDQLLNFHCDSHPFFDKLKLEALGNLIMDSVAYILVLGMSLAVLLFAIIFRDPPKINK